MVYLGYVWIKHHTPELVGVFSTKRLAYLAIRKAIKRILVDQIDVWQGYSPAYYPDKIFWDIAEWEIDKIIERYL